jgi:tripartite ATP-independent transporter DctM subunit
MALAFTFIITLAISMPIAFALGSTGVMHAIFMDDIALLGMLPQRMFAASSNTSLMAIPLFVLAGELMGFGGVTERLADMMRSFMAHVRGGMAYVTVVVGTLLGALLGSANASAALLGRIMKPELDKDGYDSVFSTCLCAATSILGPIIPPSMVFIVYGVSAQVSIGELFFAGVAPGLLLGLGFSVLIFITGRSMGIKWQTHSKTSWKDRIVAIATASPALLVPVIILGGILGGITTPTESAASASFVALILGLFVYRKLKLSDIPRILQRTGITSSTIMIIVAMANIMGWTMALDDIPQTIASGLLSLTENKWVMLLLINIFLLFVGMVMETVAAIIILVPVFLPIVSSLGIDPLHFGMVMCINLIVGLLTPPVGVALFTTSIVTGVPLRKLIKPIWTWVGICLVVLLFCTYVPSLVTFLPYTFFR